MADHTVTLTTIEERVLESYWIDVTTAIEAIVRRVVIVKARDLIYESTSEKDPRKMDISELRDELLVIQDQVPTYCERNPSDPACQDSSTP